jgi:membrane-bound serine protease (ClpP class)
MSTSSTAFRRAFVLLLLTGLLGATLAAFAGSARAQSTDDTVRVDILPVRGYLDPPVADTMTDLLQRAAGDGSALVILQVDGPGGLSVDVDGLIEAVQASPVPVVVFVSPQQGIAARAGGALGLLWAASHVRAVADVASVGPIAPAELSQQPGVYPEAQRLAELLPDASDEAMAALLSTEVPAIVLPGADPATTLEELGVVEVRASNVTGLLGELDGRTVTTAAGEVTLDLPRENVEVRLHSLGLVRRLLHAASLPAFIYLLLVIGLGMLLFEAFQPGFGVAGFAGLILLPFGIFGLTVLPVVWWAVALVLLGLLLFAVDAAMAGLGPVTAAATASFGVGSWFAFGSGTLRVPPLIAVLTTIAAIAFFVFVLTVILRAQAGPEGVEVEDLVGRLGIVRSMLNPEGHVYIDDALWRARVQDDLKLRVGAPIRVTGVDGAILLVEPFDPDTEKVTEAAAQTPDDAM